MAQQTAVDYLIEQLDEQIYRIDHKDNRINISISFEDMMALKKQAKQMEKEQIKKAYKDYHDLGHIYGFDAEQYYSENYNTQNK